MGERDLTPAASLPRTRSLRRPASATMSAVAGGLMVTMPDERELDHPRIGALVRKYLQGRAEVPTGARVFATAGGAQDGD